MRRATRHITGILFNAATVVSLALCTATVALSHGGYVTVASGGLPATNEQWAVHRIVFDSPPQTGEWFGVYAHRRVLGVHVVDWSGWRRGRRYVVLPTWPAVAALAIPAIGMVVSVGRSVGRSRAHRGLCPACGYDLRATPGRCPECGHVTVEVEP